MARAGSEQCTHIQLPTTPRAIPRDLSPLAPYPAIYHPRHCLALVYRDGPRQLERQLGALRRLPGSVRARLRLRLRLGLRLGLRLRLRLGLGLGLGLRLRLRLRLRLGIRLRLRLRFGPPPVRRSRWSTARAR